MKKIVAAIVFLLSVHAGFAQSDTSRLRVSLLTCTPGAELYSVFGHSALRVVDSAAGTDIVYNYGTFNFDDPDFYTKFIMGRLPYFLSQESFPDFVYAYSYFKRGVFEQVLNLDAEEKKNLQLFLFDNVREENKYYAYDFLYDNCTTRLRDLIFRTPTGTAFDPPPLYKGPRSFRDHLHTYLDRAEMQWTKLGIDLLLGAVIDKEMTVGQSMFLPEYLAQGVSLAGQGGKKLMSVELTQVPDQQPAPEKLAFWQTPVAVFTFFAFLIIFPVFTRGRRKISYQLFADRFVLILTGVLGVFLLFMWFGTNHRSCSNNLNLIWAMPFNLILGFLVPVKKAWHRYYFKVYSMLLLGLFCLMMVMPGWINASLMPLIIALSYRSWMMGKME